MNSLFGRPRAASRIRSRVAAQLPAARDLKCARGHSGVLFPHSSVTGTHIRQESVRVPWISGGANW